MAKEISNNDLFELITKMYNRMEGMDDRMEGMDSEIQEIKRDMATKDQLREVRSRVILIEEEHGKKLDLLFDGYKQNSDKLDRIEKKVTRHEEIILRKVR